MPTCIDCGVSGARFRAPEDRRYRRDRCRGCAYLGASDRRERRDLGRRVTHCVVCGEALFDPITLVKLESPKRAKLLPPTLFGIRDGRIDEGRALRSDRLTCSARCRQRKHRAV